MVKRPLLLLSVCLVLLVTAYDASAQGRQSGAAGGAASVKTAKSNKETAKAPEKSGTVNRTKKSSPKPVAQSADRARGDASKTKASKNRKPKRPSRDPSSLPLVDEDFAEAPHSVMGVLAVIPVDGEFSSLFGPRRLSGKTKRFRMHTGVDIRAPQGTPVLAPASGIVSYARAWANYGKVVEIDHGNGLVTRYAHLDSHTVAEGDMVETGDQIGAVGRTGRATGMHLHFETLVNGRYVDPLMAEMWAQAPGRLIARRGTYVSGLRAPKSYN